MPDSAQINRSIGTIKTELEFLGSSGALSPPQLQSIQAQLPQQSGQQSQYTDARFVNGGNHFNPAWVAQQAQDPNNPAHPQHPKHHEWAKDLAHKFGNAAVYGAGATFGSDLINDAMRKF
ncbi:hypothetical protein K504DRAFT_458164 [Pleomassaria siparia CBS 279.74]|uniref:Uncharacterized protein n=1 Tax=Pleomassaria siparia CBS 279.74 TaxID=1314801 RepID=A0A6G1K5E6_9PLEO|nr:hypothetical protein K504DRAFT_458164 [Pleomassaria siparia CBS 279.74]